MTARAGTEVEIANLALGHLKQEAIATMTDDSSRARAVNDFFALARDAALRLRWWNFATTWQVLAAASGAVHPKYTYVYPLPADCLLVRFIDEASDDQWSIESMKYSQGGVEVEASVLVTNIAAPRICYTRAVENPKLWNADFNIAFSYQLAAFAGPRIGASTARVEQCASMATSWREEAAQGDAREKSNERITYETSVISVRRVGGRRPYYPRNT